MKTILRYFLAVALFLVTGHHVLPQNRSDEFLKGTGLYTEGKFREAYDQWMGIFNSGERTASLCFNIGNACFKMNDIPGAILFYERALLLSPADEEINYNLQVARTMVVDKFAEIPELFFITGFNFVSLILPSNTWAKISFAAFIITLVMLLVYLFTIRYRLKVTCFWISIVAFVLCASAFTFSLRNKQLVWNSDKAVIFTSVVTGKSSPGESGNDLFVIHEGSKVTIEDEVGGWYEIRLSDGNVGWVPSNTLTRL